MIRSTRDNSFTKIVTLQNSLVLLILVSIVLAQLSLLLPSHQSLTGRDSGIFLYIGKIILEGKTPYLDVWENKGPLIFYINAFGLLIGSGSRWGVWFVELVFLFFAVYIGFKITKKFFGLPSAILSTIIWVLSLSSVSQGGNLTEQYSLLFSFVGIACYLWGAEKTQMRRFDFLLGLSLGLNFLLRPNNIGAHLAIVFSLLFFLIGILLFFKKYLDIIFQFMYIAFIINIKSPKMKAKKYTCLDIALIKFAVIAFVLFAVAMCPWLQNWLLEVCPWYLLIAAILLSIKPVITFFGQKGS